VVSASAKYYEVKYLKKVTKWNNFVLDEEAELYSLPIEDIVRKLPPSVSLGKSKRKMNQASSRVIFILLIWFNRLRIKLFYIKYWMWVRIKRNLISIFNFCDSQKCFNIPSWQRIFSCTAFYEN
jgi:hypothetical protein